MFKGIIGHEPVKTFLEKSIATDRVAHAYLFLGPAHTGKMTIARVFAEALLRKEDSLTHTLETHPDVTFTSREIDEKTGKLKSELTIDQIRELNTRISHTALFPSWKIAIVEYADTMNKHTANALLKTLEEPKGKTIIILLVSDLQRILPTIRSRSQLIRFRLVARDTLVHGLMAQGADRHQAEKLAALADGRPGMAIRFFEDPNLYKEWKEALGERSQLFSKPLYARLRWIDEHIKKIKTEKLTQEFYLWRTVLREKMLADVESPQPRRALRRLEEAETATRHHVDSRLAFQYFLS